MLFDGQHPNELTDSGRLSVVFDELPLLPQYTYAIRMGARRSDGHTLLFPSTEVASFRVVGTARGTGYDSEFADNYFPSAAARVIVPYTWLHPDGLQRRVNPRDKWRIPRTDRPR
jgi:hypothetical protein